MLAEELENSLNSVVSAVHESAAGLRKRTIGTLEKMGSLGSFTRTLAECRLAVLYVAAVPWVEQASADRVMSARIRTISRS
jgi:hypothetical protein